MINDFKKHPYYSTFVVTALIVFIVILLNGCASPEQNARSLLDRLEFDPGEYGSFELEGNLDLNPLPFFSSQVHVKLEKTKPAPAVQLAPEEPPR